MSKIILTSLIVCVFGCSVAFSQNAPPFFGGGVVAYSPTISTVNSGAVFDASAVVSFDRKYVTIGAQAQDSSLIALRDFPIAQGPALGFVGGVSPAAGAGAPGGFAAAVDGTPPSPAQIQRAAIAARSVLNQRGMYQLAH
jgi:hypothetical protein